VGRLLSKLDAALIKEELYESVKYAVKNHVVTYDIGRSPSRACEGPNVSVRNIPTRL